MVVGYLAKLKVQFMFFLFTRSSSPLLIPETPGILQTLCMPRNCKIDSDGCATSPRYPSRYNNNRDCEIEASRVQHGRKLRLRHAVGQSMSSGA